MLLYLPSPLLIQVYYVSNDRVTEIHERETIPVGRGAIPPALAPCVIFTQSKSASDSSGYFGAYLICYKHLVIFTVYCVVNVQIEMTLKGKSSKGARFR
jgi:hypothetical protein